MFEMPLTVPKFMAAWLPALAVSSAVPARSLGDMFLVDMGGLAVPVVTCGLGALGILASRPFTMRSERDLGWKLRWLVSAILLVTVELWIVESRPGWLFAFVVAIGMGFAGYSLLELFGEQVKETVRAGFDRIRETIGRTGRSDGGPDSP